ncbi:hypothetical protein [Ralstonia flatus]|uniref:Uncharacterized protein n=1 Tax=Ralstonia flatus TaxID=3058601 RepID=A0AAD2F714_9RALS|nr:hypothetical protein [Ralstonia sp. LMG 32965]CAJ0849602.1 hypothetical protein R77567_00330 [Ralstonia sp. LMG 32965]CAJ0856778.1 hypothetical protein R77564_00408 [Ralstonia sp. LMG 32965]
MNPMDELKKLMPAVELPQGDAVDLMQVAMLLADYDYARAMTLVAAMRSALMAGDLHSIDDIRFISVNVDGVQWKKPREVIEGVRIDRAELARWLASRDVNLPSTSPALRWVNRR